LNQQDSTRPVALAVSGVEKTLGGTLILGGVSFSAERGSLTAILGSSGSGKTTLLRLIAGLERPDRGAISLAGRVVDSSREHTPPERRRIGYVPQEGALFPHLTVAGNVSFGLRSRRLRPTAAERGRVSELIEMIGLSGFERRFPHQLSGGERHRARDRPARRAVLIDRRGAPHRPSARDRRPAQTIEYDRNPGDPRPG
jgi:iron(III) transport system ATP-binding protein